MVRVFLFIVAAAALVAGGCGSESEPGVTPEPGIVEGPPSWPDGPAPKLETDGPPPAWIETRAGSFWLAYSTYCWKTVCADYIAPSCDDERLPRVMAEPDEQVRFHLRFEAAKLNLSFVPAKDVVGTADVTPLTAGREATWTVDRSGAFLLAASTGDGQDARYAGCIHFQGDAGASVGVPAPGGGLSVEEALASDSAEVLLVQGGLLADGDEVRLCSGFAESHPPQCAGASLLVLGLDLTTVQGLKREGETAWADQPVKLLGTVEGAVLKIAATAQ